MGPAPARNWRNVSTSRTGSLSTLLRDDALMATTCAKTGRVSRAAASTEYRVAMRLRTISTTL